MMILRSYVARCLLPEARASFVADDAVIGLLSNSKGARNGAIIARRYLATRTSIATVSVSSAEPTPAPPAACSSTQYVLPPPSWSLADLKLVQRSSDSDNVDEGTARAVLSREEVRTIIMLLIITRE